MDNSVCKIGHFLPFQGCVTFCNTVKIMSNNIDVTTTATKTLYLKHCYKGSTDFKGVEFRARHPSNPYYPL